MTVITGLNGVDWLAVFAASFGLGVAVLSVRPGPGRRLGPYLVVPFLVGVATTILAVAAHTDTLRRAGSAHFAALPVAMAVLGTGFVFADFVNTRVLPMAMRSSEGRSPDTVALATLLSIVIVGFLLLGLIELRAPEATTKRRSLPAPITQVTSLGSSGDRGPHSLR